MPPTLPRTSIPMDTLSPILQILVGDWFRFFAMSGIALYHRSTRLSGFSLEMTMRVEEESLFA